MPLEVSRGVEVGADMDVHEAGLRGRMDRRWSIDLALAVRRAGHAGATRGRMRTRWSWREARREPRRAARAAPRAVREQAASMARRESVGREAGEGASTRKEMKLKKNKSIEIKKR
jgi:hypothetical protein